MNENDNESTARTYCSIARGQIESRCKKLAQHVLIELAAIATDEDLSATVRREAHALLEESAA